MILNRISIKLLIVVYFAAILAFSSGCKQKQKISGSDFIPEKKLVQVITDIHLMDGITNDMKYYRKFNPGDSIDLYGSIFEKYNIDKQQYKRTIDEYSKYPDLLDNVYDQVLMQLSILQEKVENDKVKNDPSPSPENEKPQSSRKKKKDRNSDRE